MKKRSRVSAAALALVVAVGAQAAERAPADAALVDRVKEAAINELREGGALDRAARKVIDATPRLG